MRQKSAHSSPSIKCSKTRWHKWDRHRIAQNKIIEEQRDLANRQGDILPIEAVAKHLCCSVNAVRNIPSDLLPRRKGVGKRNLYLKKDVIAFVECTGNSSPKLDLTLAEVRDEQLDSKVDSENRHSRKKESGND